MPFDQRRVNGPEVTYNYHVFTDSKKKDTLLKNLLKQRAGNRKYDELRKIFVKTGVVSQAKGSAYLEIGDTKVVCSVFDPREIPKKNDYSVQGELYCEFKFATFSCQKRRLHQQDTEEKQYSLIMQRALEPAVCLHEFPNFQVDVYATVLDNGGSALGAAIIGASLALADARVPMFGLVTATTAAIYGDTVFLDPTAEEEELCSSTPLEHNESQDHGIIMQATLPQHEQTSEVFIAGFLSVERIKSTMSLLNTCNQDILPVLHRCLVKSAKKSLK